jgi:ABC-type phosphate transport system auxiliary subunit
MISTREKVVMSLSDLTEAQLREVAEYLEFLKFRERRKGEPQLDEAELEALYAEFADEDRELAESGLTEYATNLEREDMAQ